MKQQVNLENASFNWETMTPEQWAEMFTTLESNQYSNIFSDEYLQGYRDGYQDGAAGKPNRHKNVTE